MAATVLQEGHEPSVQHTNAPGTKVKEKFESAKIDSGGYSQRQRKVSKSLESAVASSVSFEDLVMTMHSPWPEIHSNLTSCFISWSKYVAFVSRPTRPARLGKEDFCP